MGKKKPKNIATGTYTHSVIAQKNIDNVHNYVQESSKIIKPSMLVPKGCGMFARDVMLSLCTRQVAYQAAADLWFL